jgi:hypothetical protein
MAKKKNPTDQSQPDRHKNRLVGLRLEPDIFDALKAHADGKERSVAWMAAKLLKKIMVLDGILPPQQGT